jgi:hypothetical protein
MSLTSSTITAASKPTSQRSRKMQPQSIIASDGIALSSISALADSNNSSQKNPKQTGVSPIDTKSPTESTDGDIEAMTPPADAVPIHTSTLERNVKWKTAATFLALWLAGVADGSNGAIIPYLQGQYAVGLGLIALM